MKVMPKIFLKLLLGYSILFPVASLAQANPDTLTYFPSDRVRGGAPTFYKLMSEYISYPTSSRNSRIVGTAIVALTISPTGNLNGINMVNSLGKEVDQTIRRAIDQTRDQWLADPLVQNDIVVFVPFTFVLDGNQFLQHTDKPLFITEDITVVGRTTGPSPVIERDADVAEKANRSYQKEQYSLAIRYLDELIRRNPYDKNLYLMRGNAYYQMGKREQGCADFAKVKDFLGHKLPPASVAMCK